LQDHRVVEWVAHGLNLPQYAAAFKRNAITALDFPLLVADGGAMLQQELGIASKLHREQVGWGVGDGGAGQSRQTPASAAKVAASAAAAEASCWLAGFH
jgi:hypothetical protein